VSGDEDRPHYHGHRERLRRRLLESGGASLADYELLEFLLFGSRPRGDVKPLAKELLARHGGLGGVLGAEARALMQAAGMGEASVALLKAVEEAAKRLAREQIIDRPVLSSWDKVLDYCRTTLGYEPVERFHLLFLDKRNVLIADETQQRGTVDHTPVYPREVVKRALELGASALILVHNHPSGDTTPSRADIAMTAEIVEAAEHLGIVVHDHVIISRSGHASFKSMGLL